jgi:hypothetical protein
MEVRRTLVTHPRSVDAAPPITQAHGARLSSGSVTVARTASKTAVAVAIVHELAHNHPNANRHPGTA